MYRVCVGYMLHIYMIILSVPPPLTPWKISRSVTDQIIQNMRSDPSLRRIAKYWSSRHLAYSLCEFTCHVQKNLIFCRGIIPLLYLLNKAFRGAGDSSGRGDQRQEDLSLKNKFCHCKKWRNQTSELLNAKRDHVTHWFYWLEPDSWKQACEKNDS